MRPLAHRTIEFGMLAECPCGRSLPLSRTLLNHPGQTQACPACGHEKRVWQWAATANRKGEKRGEENL